MRKVLILVTALMMVMMMALSAQAEALLDFDMSPPTAGTISYGGGASVLSGHNISVDTVTGINTPLHNGVTLTIVGGEMFFETGPFVGLGTGEYEFSIGNGFLNIFGAIPGIGLANTQLLSGFPLIGPSDPHVAITPAGGTVLFNFADEKNIDLLAYYGLTSSVSGSLNLSFAVTGGINPNVATAFTSSTILSGDVVNTPIPGSLLLLGSGIMGVVGIGIRRKSA
jgi:hypothetical protein